MFQPLTLRGVTFPNRIWLAPMCQYSIVEGDGVPRDWHLVHLGSRAAGGYGLLIAEATAVLPEGRITPRDAGLWTDEQGEAWGRIVHFLHDAGTLAGVQISHAGRKASSWWPWAPVQGSVPEDDGGWPVLAPSATPFPGMATPQELTVEEIGDLVAAFAAAAGRAAAAGFDVLEVQAGHGFLLHQFLSPLSNLREDAYGGALEERARLLVEVVDAVRETWPEDRPLLVRLSATDWLPGGFETGEAAQVAAWLGEHGVDLVDVSTGGLLPAPIPAMAGYQVPHAREIRDRTGLPVSAVGLITDPEHAEQILLDGAADVVLVGRVAMRDPMWPRRAAHVLEASASALPWPPQYLRGAWG